jgi:hypothetical protein
MAVILVLRELDSSKVLLILAKLIARKNETFVSGVKRYG